MFCSETYITSYLAADGLQKSPEKLERTASKKKVSAVAEVKAARQDNLPLGKDSKNSVAEKSKGLGANKPVATSSKQARETRLLSAAVERDDTLKRKKDPPMGTVGANTTRARPGKKQNIVVQGTMPCYMIYSRLVSFVCVCVCVCACVCVCVRVWVCVLETNLLV